jgi:uncharacterized protein YggE
VTRKTRTQFDADVRAGAVKDAIAKAGHYAAALGPGGNLRVVEIHDRGSSGPPMYKPRMMMAAAHVGGGQQPPSLSFEPEPVEVSASVEVKAVF